ncbi:4-phosphoerythronate dehydrogenase [Catenovulum sp. SM1970]|uniref:4-phosphoerythronate dehydrogenase n=1 Tax=Marinifaba aquimaris TaxID=2741323 RepID=UPI0015727133|nr:4-phosphoerythronate dehydrogenase [Marinifaba aquimaris]NTS78255.1 4-phosphoerythronate dehydrogenase [Marinifaba aquimaris]
MSQQLSIMIEDSLLYAEEFFNNLGHITRFSGSKITAEQLRGVDVLLTRSTTKVSQSLLSQADKLKFVGTATAGFNHLDTDYLTAKGIEWTAAPGCNADAVADYVLSGMLTLSQQDNFQLKDKQVAVVGVGQIGSRVVRRLTALGCEVLSYDPVRAKCDDDFKTCTFDEVLKADIITCHVPLTLNGDHPTHHLFDLKTFQQLKPNAILINACRGEIFDNMALKAFLQMSNKLTVVLDVWENEPNIDMDLLQLVDFASPHIAGHSLEGKARGTEMLYYSLCSFLGLEPEFSLHDFLPEMPVEQIELSATTELDENLVRNLTRFVYDIRNDDVWFRKGMKANPKAFAKMRKSYPVRRELTSLVVSTEALQHQTKLIDLSFRTSN